MTKLHRRGIGLFPRMRLSSRNMQEFHALKYYQHFLFFNKLNPVQCSVQCIFFRKLFLLPLMSFATFEYCSHSEGISRMETQQRVRNYKYAQIFLGGLHQQEYMMVR